MKLIDRLENFILTHNPYFNNQVNARSQVLLIPGMSASAWQLLPLARYLKQSLNSNYAVTIVPLGFSWDSFSNLLFLTEKVIDSLLVDNSEVEEVILIGHSHGGRIAWNASAYLQKKYPNLKLKLITMASPLDYRPKIPIINTIVSRFSQAYREWPKLKKLDLQKIAFTAIYSDIDLIVSQNCATSKIKPQNLLLIKGLQHFQFMEPRKIGAVLLELITNKQT